MRKFLIGTLAALACSTAALAQQWPSSPLRYIVPFPAGGSTDAISRQLAEAVGAKLGQSIVVENVGGAGGVIGVTRLARSAPDGYTIGLGNTATLTINPNLLAKPPYDPLKDLTPISLITDYTNVLVINAALKVDSLQSLVALSKEKPDGLTYSSAGAGSSNHLSGALLAHETGANLVHVPFKGNAAALTAVAGGHVDFMFATISEVLPFIHGGTVRALATTGKTREAQFPDVPTVAESYPNYEVVGFMGVLGPAGMPADVTKRLNQEIVQAMTSPAMRERLDKLGFVARSSTPEELSERIRSEGELWKGLIKASGIAIN